MRTFNVTREAVKQVKAALEKRKNYSLNAPGAALRIGVRSGGCSGYRYHMEFSDADPRETDNIFAFQNVEESEIIEIRIYIDRKSIIYLTGAELVWRQGQMSWGFEINNPSVKSECGCKESFSV